MKRRVITFSTVAMLALSALALCAGLSACSDPTLGNDNENPTHTHSYATEVVAPTCTEKGYTLHTCECGETYRDTYTDIIAHNYGEWEVTTAAACETDGEQKRNCTVCGEEQREAIAATGHNYTTEVVAPTCTEQGYTLRTCACGETIKDTYTDKVAHNYGDWEVTTAATCETDGEQKRNCTVCGDEQREAIAATGHNYATEVIEPTCTEKGCDRHTCTLCGDVYEDNYTDKVAHSYGAWEVITAAACETDGEQKRYCKLCGDEQREVITATGHNYTTEVVAPTCTERGYTLHTCECGETIKDTYTDIIAHNYGEWEETTAATCVTDGEQKRNCTVCGDKQREAIAATGHNYATEVVAPTCTERGYTLHTCECGETIKDTYTDIIAHNYGEWEETTAATCVTDGEQKRNCTVCGEEQREAIAATGHNYTTKVIEPTCTEQGYTLHTCECGETIKDTYTDIVAHNYGDWEVTTAAACETDGEQKRNCTVCGEEQREAIVATGHTYTRTEVFAPTCTEQGYTLHTCECGETYKDNYTDIIAHNYTENVCTECGLETAKFALSNDGNSYSVTGMKGDSTEINIQSKYKGKPVTGIGSSAFQNCSGLTSITIPDGVTSIGEGAFQNCSGLTSVTIPNSVTSIGDYAFYGCSGLTSITIPDGVTSIGEDTFRGCSGLTSVTIPNSVTSIGNYAFQDCSGLTSITIPNSVTSIGDYAFYGCSGLTRVNITDLDAWYGINFGSYYANPLSCAQNLYVNNELITEVVIPNSVISIGDYAFAGYSGLTSVTIPNSVTSIGNYAFQDCSGLTRVNITDLDAWYGIKFRNNFANPLYYAHNLYVNNELITEVVIPNGVTSIGNSVFAGLRSLTSVTIPNGVTIIGEDAFKDCSGLTSVTIPNSVTSIGDSAFEGCSGLTSVTIPNSVTSIGNYTFSDCSGLTSVTIPNSVTSIGKYAFYGCNGLTSITIPNSVTSIGKYAFWQCSGLTRVNITDLDAWYGINFGSYYANPLSYAHNLYVNNELITEVVIPNSVISIGDYAFAGYSGLTSVTIPNSVMSIGEGAFQGCSGLTSVTIPNSVTSIGDSAFDGCSGLTSITIPNSVTSIGKYAFYGCSGLKSINYQGTKAQWTAISKGSDWNYGTGYYTVKYTDGDLAKK